MQIYKYFFTCALQLMYSSSEASATRNVLEIYTLCTRRRKNRTIENDS